MKNIYSFILAIILLFNIKAQTPQGFNYQGVARNASGAAITNQAIGLQISILDGSASGTTVYTETHNQTTDANGLFSLTIGGGTATLGTFTGINWAVGGSKWLKISMDAAGGSNYQLIGSSQLMSVPYALFAGNVTNNGGKQTLVLSDNVTDAQAAAIIAAEVGPNTQEVRIVGTTNLTTVDLSMLNNLIYVEIDDNAALTTVNLSALTRCDGVFNISQCPALNTLNLSALTKINSGFFNITSTALTNITLSNLSKVSGYINFSDNPSLTIVSLPIINSIANLDIRNDSSLTTINYPNLLTAKGDINIVNCKVLNSINFNSLTSCDGINFQANKTISTLVFPVLTNITEGLTIRNNVALVNFSFPVLTFIKSNFSLEGNSALTGFSLPVLNTTGNLFVGGNNVLSNFILPIISISSNFGSSGSINVGSGNLALNTISLPNLVALGSINISSGNNVLTTLNFPALTSLIGLTSFSTPQLTTINMPLVTVIGTSTASNNTNSIFIQNSLLTNFSLPSLTTLYGSIGLIQNKLSSSNVNGLLAKLVAITPNLTGRFFSFQGQSPLAPPTGQGIADKATLIANGNSVNTD
jgi:hypothetical protein